MLLLSALSTMLSHIQFVHNDASHTLLLLHIEFLGVSGAVSALQVFTSIGYGQSHRQLQ